MADEVEYVKIAYGPKSHIKQALKDGLIDGNDIVFTTDTSELVWITEDGKQKLVKPRNLVFDDVGSAKQTLNASSDTYAGQTVMIKNPAGNYESYTVQNSPSGSGFTVTSNNDTDSKPSLVWHEI